VRILFVSKPVAPPFHDGAKCLVRDVACNLTAARATILTTRDAPPLAPNVNEERIYPAAGSFAPRAADNALVLARLLRGDRHDLWHFVFAPNPASSSAARLALGLRRVPSVQTVASVPRSFDGAARLLFGDRVVCLSASTRDRLVAAGVDAGRCDVIPPPVPLLRPYAPAEQGEALARAGLAQSAARGPNLLYPGDLEFSGGARAVAGAIDEILKGAPDATIAFACRAKTARAAEIEAGLRARLARFGGRVVFIGEVPSLPPLIAASALVLFPVDDLYGKVDLPIALLEAMALGVPVVALRRGPLAELDGARMIDDEGELAGACLELLGDAAATAQIAAEGRAAIERRHRPADVAAAYEAVYRRVLG
jgi:glycosyltransferase involved in cell wall biosynthesis